MARRRSGISAGAARQAERYLRAVILQHPARPDGTGQHRAPRWTRGLGLALAALLVLPGMGLAGSAAGTAGTNMVVPDPSYSPRPLPTPMPTITPPPRPTTVETRVPSTTLANLGALASEMPAPYYDGCHVTSGGTISSKACLYGNLASHTTIAIYGDSHALAWFPAVLRMAEEHQWRVLNVTMSACSPADIVQVTNTGAVMTACTAFRKAAIAKLAKYHPTVILVTGTRGFRAIDAAGHVLTGTARTSAWTAGMERTLDKLIPIAGRVAMIADTPNSRFPDTIGCTRLHPASILACSTSVTLAVSYSWLNTEYHVALTQHVAFIDAERWVCRSSPCPLVVGSLVTHRNAGHMTLRFAKSLWSRMDGAVATIIKAQAAVIGP